MKILTSIAAALTLAVNATAEPVAVDHVWVVYKTHFDIGYNDTAANIVAKYRGPMVDGALAIIDKEQGLPKEQRFSWTIPGWPLTRMLDEQQTPERREKLWKAFQDGSIAVHALPFTTETEALELEDIVRGLKFSSDLARKAGKPLPIAAKMTDVPSHAWALPTILAHAGIRFLHIGDNQACQFPRLPPMFWWEGPDGSRVLCFYSPKSYGSPILPPKGWAARNYIALITSGDNHGPPTQQEIARTREVLAKSLPAAKVTLGSMEDFARAILAENPELPVVRADMPDTWIHGVMSNPIESNAIRAARALEPALEILDTQARLWGLDTAPAPMPEIYENSLLYGEHTWGGSWAFDIGFHYGDDFRKLLASGHYHRGNDKFYRKPGKPFDWLQTFEDKKNYARKAVATLDRELAARMALLAASVKTDDRSVIVYNPLPWSRSGLVEIDGKHLLAKDVPPCGYKVVKPAELVDKPRPTIGNTLETPHFTVTFDLNRGGISSLVEKSTGRDLCDSSSPYALGQFLHQRFSSAEVHAWCRAYGTFSSDFNKPNLPGPDKLPHLDLSPSQWSLRIKHDGATDTAVLTAGDTKGLAKGCTLTFTFPRHNAELDVAWHIEEKVPDTIPEGGWLCFPLNAKDPRFTVGRIGGPINPATDIVSGASRNLMAIATGVSVADADGSGATISPVDGSLICLDKPGLWSWSLDFVPRKPIVFLNLYNNQWNTNYMWWQDGSWGTHVRLWPTAKATAPAADLGIHGWEARTPLLAVKATGKGEKLPVTQTGVTVSRKGVLVTAFGKNPDGEGTILRLWEQAGSSGDLSVTIPGPFKSATPVNLRGEKSGEPIAIKGGILTTKLPAFAPASFILQP